MLKYWRKNNERSRKQQKPNEFMSVRSTVSQSNCASRKQTLPHLLFFNIKTIFIEK